MAIDIRGIATASALHGRVARRLAALLGRMGEMPASVRATFTDQNGPKGGVAIRCALTTRLGARPTVRVEHTARTAELAFEGALPVLARELGEQRDRAREAKRFPKKYYAARRARGEGRP